MVKIEKLCIFKQTTFPILQNNNKWKIDEKNTKFENKELKNKMEEKTILHCSQLERSNKTFPLPVLNDNLTT